MEELSGQCPDVFIQGFYCVSADGRVVFEKKLDVDTMKQVEDLACECRMQCHGVGIRW